MTGDIESRKLIQKIREALESVLKENVEGLQLTALCARVRRVVAYPISKDQIERQVRLMADAQIGVDRAIDRHYVYTWAGGAPKPKKPSGAPKVKIKPESVKDMKVRQNIIPMHQSGMVDNFGPPRSPMLWTVNVLEACNG